jgi:hypothetical protein
LGLITILKIMWPSRDMVGWLNHQQMGLTNRWGRSAWNGMVDL